MCIYQYPKVHAPLRLAACAMFLVASLVNAAVGHAGLNAWTSGGPEGGGINALAIDPLAPNTLYVGGVGAVFKSTNGGSSWAPASNGISFSDRFMLIGSLAVDPITPGVAYAGSSNEVFKTTDGGATWVSLNANGVFGGTTGPELIALSSCVFPRAS